MAADRRGGNYDGVVGAGLSRAMRANIVSGGTAVVNARVYRFLFWLGLLLLALLAVGLVQSILMPFATGFAIAYMLAPGVARLERRGVRRALGSLCLVVLFLLGLALMLVILVPLIQVQV